MVNEDYDPDAVEDAVIDVLRREGRANPYLIREQTEDLSKQQIGAALSNLTAAGWVRKVTRGLYDYVEDPRVTSRAPSADRADSPDESPVVSRAHAVLDEWEPNEANTERGRAAAKRVVAWLAAQESPQQRAAVSAWADERRDELGFSPSTLWEKVAQPALGELRDAGLAAWTANVGWEIVEKE